MSAISYVLDIIRQKQRDGILGDIIYFRGQRENNELIPAFLRNSAHYTDTLFKVENNLYCDAKVIGASDLLGVRNSWEALALLQHYGIPTRLLDWSSSLTNALFFALIKCLQCAHVSNCRKLKKACEGNPSIWVLDPTKMHEKLYPSNPIAAITIGVDPIPDYEEEFVKQDVATSNKWPYKNGPIFIEIPWLNPRIRSQKGYFTFHSDDKPMEKYIDEKSGLVKIVIPKRYRKDVVAEFNALGINDHDIFTDLVSLASYIKRRYTK